LDLDKAMCLGILSDGTAPPEVFKAFDEIIPGGAKWMRGLHTQDYRTAPYGLKGGGKVVLHEFCYGFGLTPANKPLPPLWNRRGWPGADYERISAHDQRTTLSWYRDTAVCSLFRNTKGIGRVCLDFWAVIQGPRGSKRDIYNRFPNSSCAQREPSLKALTWPGPSGAETTLRYEAFCEGIQYAEAMIALSEAVDRHADALGPQLADECRGVLTDMLQYEHKTEGREQPLANSHADFQTLTVRLFGCAAKISQKLGNPTPAH
jgi:hypothetical protein